ncbi:ATP-binding cassette domain-containing protein [Campylobacter concisus]|uniref:UvrABC system protein A n=1 Tax=Campylobacter concisus TaxID=199 RepID=A0A1Y5MNA2_9BACT|nr:excinuclease ABC subunit UvrA [Campylobacter concisus]OUT08804.1 daunorubicin resistance protein DrrC [Campylobacter concisus]
MNDYIEIIGVSENNLKHFNIKIPKGKLVVLAGVSGSGKSSLAFDTIAVESSRQWQAGYSYYLRNKMPNYERPAFETIEGLTPVIIVDQKPMGTNSRSSVGTAVDVAPLLRLLFSRVGNPSAGGSMAYSFNHPHGMCPDCTGLGKRLTLIEDRLFNLEGTLSDRGLTFSQFAAGWQNVLYTQHSKLDSDKKLKNFTDEEWNLLKYGEDNNEVITMIGNGTGGTYKVDYEGVVPRFKRLYINRDISKLKKGLQQEISKYIVDGPCPTCGGTGLNPAALASKINGYNIADMQDIQVSELIGVLKTIDNPVGKSISRQIIETLQRMIDVGIGYLTLGRRTDTLSGGEVQRLKIVRHLGSSLSNITYIFDEPTAGLHPADADRIAKLLLSLRDKHNTVLVVEHSRDIIRLADEIIELGPLAGVNGGQIVFQGGVEDLEKTDTLTAKAMRQKIKLNTTPKEWIESLHIEHAKLHNLKNVSIDIPMGVITAVCGVAGSGKSSLIRCELTEKYPEAVVIDQKPIGISSRSTPATYSGIGDMIRKKFAEVNDIGMEWFSFNSKGACTVCGGRGVIKPEIAFADPVEIVCEECGGKRFNPTALSYCYNGKNIEQVMSLTVNQAVEFFDDPEISKKLKGLRDVGLGYMTLGQSTNSMSGGENQRLKLASELNKKGNIYILDEPSTGLHYKDIENLMQVLRKMADRGNTVIIVEHRLEMIAEADWIIEMGPRGGSEGGQVIFTGVPEDLIKCQSSLTARYFMRQM